ncbi:MAG: TRAP transporter substrate-binding protein [Nitratireductor rhodophyticola]|uniref:TRAP transporter substrate-binding protein n=1 Tax=Nitratireductor rhodophyticola TaxID=2854036 RepID=UPI0032D914CD
MKISRRTVLTTGAAAAGAMVMGMPARAQSRTILRYAHVQPESHVTTASAQWLADQLAEVSSADVEMQIFPGGQLGGPDEMLDSLQVGALDFAWISAAGLAQSMPEFNVFSLSYLFDSDEHFLAAMAEGSPLYKRLQEIVGESPYGVELAGILGGVPRNLYNNVRGVEKPSDLDGIKVRVQSSPVEARVWSALGASPQQLAWTEIYTGLQTGVVNGAESSIDAYLSSNFNEVAPYLSLTRHQYMVLPLLMSKRTYEKVGDHAQDLVRLAAESGVRNQIEYQNGSLASLRKAVERGATVSEPDIAPFREAVADIVQGEADRYNANDILQMIAGQR